MADSQYWFSLVAAAPQPENEEAVNVAVVIGNGRTAHLAFVEDLPRLCGIATPAEVAIYESILRAIADDVGRGMDVAELRVAIGPQLRLSRPRALYRTPDSALITQLKQRYLERPKASADADEMRRLAQRSSRALDEALTRLVPIGLETKAKVNPKRLYGVKLERRLAGYRVPTLARAIRAPGRDLLLDSIIIEPESIGRPLRGTAFRVGEAFHAYKQLQPDIRAYADTEIRLVGVIHRGPTLDRNAAAAREYVRHVWSTDALVIDGNEKDVREELMHHMRWLRARE